MAKNNNLPVFPDWKIIRKIGSGSYGTVYEIERELFGKTEKAALKIISIPKSDSEVEDLVSNGYDRDDIIEHFNSVLESVVREYQLMSEMKGHTNIVYCDDIQVLPKGDGIGWTIYIRMELLSPLSRTVDDNAEEDQVIRLGKDLCNALILCRSRNILHRDIKPQNIFVSKDGDYKLGDFGIAKVAEYSTRGTRIGTYHYMAPEIFNCEPYGHAADLYSLGLVMYWMLNERRLPFVPLPPDIPSAEEMEKSLMKRFDGRPLPPPVHGSQRLKQIVLKACAFETKDRYATAEDLLADLTSLSSPSSLPQHQNVKGKGRNRKRIYPILGVIALIMAVYGFLLYSDWQKGSIPPSASPTASLPGQTATASPSPAFEPSPLPGGETTATSPSPAVTPSPKPSETADTFYALLREGKLTEAADWLTEHAGTPIAPSGYRKWIEDYLPFCGKWKLYEGDQSLIAYSAGITFRNLDSIRTVVTIAGDTATIHISDTDGKEIISLDSPFGETNFVLGTDRSRYYVRLNQLGHFTYLRYDGDPGSVPVGSCEYRPES